MAYLDEWQNFLHLPTPMASVLAEARGLSLGMVLAHQHLGQLPTEAQHAVLANARSKVVFQLPAGDARLIAREFGGVLTDDDLQGLGAYEVAAELFAAGTTQPVATAKTRPMGKPTSSADDVRAAVPRALRGRPRGRREATPQPPARPGGCPNRTASASRRSLVMPKFTSPVGWSSDSASYLLRAVRREPIRERISYAKFG